MAKQSSPSLPQDNRLNIAVDEFKTSLNAQIEEGNRLMTKVKSELYSREFDNEYKVWNDYNFEFLKQSFHNPLNDQMNSYNQAGHSFLGLLGEIQGNPAQTLINTLEYKLNNLNSLLKRAGLFKSSIVTNEYAQRVTSDKPAGKEVFIVHGHDELAKVSLARFLEKLNLKPIILHEQSNAGKTIIEKIEAYTNVGFAVILYTECDLGGKDIESLHPRARQNVVFEHGFLMGKIGRSNVCALVKGQVETPGDISGVVYTTMDDGQAWHTKLALELKSSNYDIDMNKLYS